jgi:hypothetical protein
MNATTQAVVEVIGDRVVGIALIIGLCFCWRQTCQYWERRLHVRVQDAPIDTHDGVAR